MYLLKKEITMSLLSKVKNWKVLNELWDVIQPFVLKLVDKNVPKYITKLYENLAKYTKPAIDSLFALKEKIKTTPNELDNYCFNQGVDAIESFAKYLLGVVADLRK